MNYIQMALSILIGILTSRLCRKHEIGFFSGMALCIALSLLLGVVFIKMGWT